MAVIPAVDAISYFTGWPNNISESQVERAAAILVQAIADAAAGAVSDDEVAAHA